MFETLALCLMLAPPPANFELAEPAAASELPSYDVPVRPEVEQPAPRRIYNRRSVAVGATLIGLGAVALAGGIALFVLAYSKDDLCTDMGSCSRGCYKTEGRCDDFPLRVGYVVGGATLLLSSAGFVVGGSVTIRNGSRVAQPVQLGIAPTGMVLRF
jgi:hypothetical protein